jgi:hypothetical protein
MKQTTVHSLVIARTLLERAEPLCASNDRYLASAGLVILQDALETVFYAGLIERGADDEKGFENKHSFEDLIAALKAVGITVPKSGTLKALNKQRVLTKHYAQVAEPVTVRSYFEAASIAIETTVKAATGLSIREFFMADILEDGQTKEHLKEAEKALAKRAYLDALIETRKAIFIEFEEAYNVYGWRDYDAESRRGPGLLLLAGGWNAPYWTKNKKWIDANVKVPTDYVQIDPDNWRLQAMEYGIHTAEFTNVRRLTPAVFRKNYGEGWSVTYDAAFPVNNANEQNARYCLDRAVSFVLKKQEHYGTHRAPSADRPFDPPTVYIGRVMYERPCANSKPVHTIDQGYEYTIKRIVGGFDPNERFYELIAESVERKPGSLLGDVPVHSFSGFLQIVPEDDPDA